jgi:hypothetical protein
MRTRKAVPLGVLVALIGVLMLSGPLAGLAMAQEYPPTTPPTTPPVAGETIIPTSVAPEVEEAPGAQPGAGAEEEEGAPLAFTGAELTLLLAAFGILLAGGAAALIAARRRGRPGTG